MRSQKIIFFYFQLQENTSGSSECGSTQHTMSTLDETRGRGIKYFFATVFQIFLHFQMKVRQAVIVAAVSFSIITLAISEDQQLYTQLVRILQPIT